MQPLQAGPHRRTHQPLTELVLLCTPSWLHTSNWARNQQTRSVEFLERHVMCISLFAPNASPTEFLQIGQWVG